jgi:hypothetical protein
MKFLSMGAKSLHADRQTDRQTDGHDEVNSRFNNFENAPKSNMLCELNAEILVLQQVVYMITTVLSTVKPVQQKH